MLPTTYHPEFRNNIFERLTSNIVKQLHPKMEMAKDYDQLLNKWPGKTDAVFAWHQGKQQHVCQICDISLTLLLHMDFICFPRITTNIYLHTLSIFPLDMGYWPGPKALGVEETATCTFSLAVDDSTEENGCLRYVPGSGLARKLRQHAPLSGSRDEGHALTIEVDESKGDVIKLAQCKRGSVTVHDEFVIHGSGGNMSKDKQRRTYVLAYRPKTVVEAERAIGFTHSHNDVVNWDTFNDGEERKKK